VKVLLIASCTPTLHQACAQRMICQHPVHCNQCKANRDTCNSGTTGSATSEQTCWLAKACILLLLLLHHHNLLLLLLHNLLLVFLPLPPPLLPLLSLLRPLLLPLPPLLPLPLPSCKGWMCCAGRAKLDRQRQGSREAAHAERGWAAIRWVTTSALVSLSSSCKSVRDDCEIPD